MPWLHQLPDSRVAYHRNKGSGAHDARDSRSTEKNRYIAETPEEKYAKDRDTIIAYIIKTTGCSSRDAIRKMSPFEGHEDVIVPFAAWIEQKKAIPSL